ncbi:MAG: acetyl-CoA carboxylase carboxyltransferase subunit beta [Candidatus Marinimicrobia bacterium]|jgi:acetyl-CoA carboxylase carboxyl transferase subunit beta|nr:acetyl-CoA carboxylase carboxyltransferase subunit beta [Candidatus Neomarinimicrobiota bacterium]MBT4362127.1 acetyl-CoA carboxylase carboxyltransferase subunit beta [Candidatus Neomarinimicrobiota bacterium]MBT4713650.1 acetyl-CoA carboxylase carboxyltransferase subunit beta [Candidatus Neomarinimicrobiota bacterium]MBT4945334.1 acetyl-CoA carboxylase carboxyltransferase subunit beta [Candidatus Neomarinimicrobiota bacterium]MBT5269595.1 acetyl-CoA carboxylase carboxyltransferase subunit b
MSWFRRKDKNIQTENSEKKDIKEGLWVKCPSCRQILYKAELMQSNNVCYKCGYHFRIPAASYIDILLDTDGRQQHFQGIKPLDPLKFKAQKKYGDQIIAAQQKTGHNEAVQVFEGLMFERPIVVAVMDFSFIGGSMGSAVGELLAKSADLARANNTPLIIVSASGGARMMEGAYSLMQMAKTSAKLSQLADAKIPYISIMTDPTTGGVTASFAMLGDVNIAEPGALIGFAGQRVIKQTIGADLPEGFQRAEFLLEKGFLDLIVPRDDLKKQVAEILDILHAKT